MSRDLFSYDFHGVALSYLRIALNNPEAEFRSGQLESILSIVQDRKKLLLVQKTGWGKSMIYFIATKILRDPEYYRIHLNQDDVNPGPALLVSPLISLMRNQIFSGSNIISIDRLDSSQDYDDYDIASQNFKENKLDLLMISPERLSNTNFVETCLVPMANKISLLIIDEAHCISDWGHDFRPDYMRIKSMIKNLAPRTPMIATTATANKRVSKDVSNQLGEETKVLRGELSRKSLKLMTKIIKTDEERLAYLASIIPKINGAGIIYALTIRHTERIAEWLRKNGINAKSYHSNLENEKRDKRETELLLDDVDVIVATSALGMGFDKPNLKFVIHYHTPQSIVHYYQQVGRAGRNIDNAYGICIYGPDDEEINQSFIENAFPEKEVFESVISALQDSNEPIRAQEIYIQSNQPQGQIEKALKILGSMDNAPIIKNKKNMWQKTPNPLSIDWDKVDEIKSVRRNEWKDIKDYIGADVCHMNFLSKKLDDEIDGVCGKCNYCDDLDKHFNKIDENKIIEAGVWLEKIVIPIKPRKIWTSSNFKEYDFFKGKIKSDEILEEGRALCHISDPIFGKMIMEGKQNLKFDDKLIEKAVKVINEYWDIEKNFTLVTCIPSANKQSLVPELAKKIAEKIDSPFIELINKVKNTQPQKTMKNSSYKKSNLDGAFEVIENVKHINNQGRVLLVDDIVESGWTFTIAGALLRKKGYGDVYPFALGYRKGEAIIEKHIK